VNAQALCVFRLRNKLELDAIIEELSAVYSKEQLLEMYELATREPYSFWYIYLAARRREDMFFLRFEKRMTPLRGAPEAFSSNGKGQNLVEDGSLDADPSQGPSIGQPPRG
ncbi:MAG: hypothetical protein R6W83_05555, partial [Cryobacterium sp.]